MSNEVNKTEGSLKDVNNSASKNVRTGILLGLVALFIFLGYIIAYL